MKKTLPLHLTIICIAMVFFVSLPGIAATAGANQWLPWGSPDGDGGLVHVLALAATDEHTVYAGTNEGGLFTRGSSDEGWTPLTNGLTDTHVEALAIDPSTQQTIYAGTGAGVFKSTDGGASWLLSSSGIAATNILVLAIDPGNPETIYAGSGEGVWKSVNGGGSWTSASDGLFLGDFSDGIIYSLALDPLNIGTLYAGGWRGVFKSTDGGEQWELVYPSVMGLITALAIDPVDTRTIYAGAWQGGVVSKSTDGGLTWTSYDTGAGSVNAFVIDPDQRDIVYAGTGSGVMKSTDGGVSWAPVNEGLLDTSVLSLILDAPGSGGIETKSLYAGMMDSGVWRYDLGDQSTREPVFSGRTDYPAGNDPVSLVIGDVDGDGQADLAAVNFYGGEVSVLLGNGNGTFRQAISSDASDHPSALAMGDLNGDGVQDLAITNFYEFNKILVLLGNGDGSFNKSEVSGAGDHPSSLAVRDLDGDTILDLAVTNFVSDDVSVMLGNGDGTFRAAMTYPAGRGPVDLVIEDVNGDTILDLAVTNFFADTISVLLGRGNGIFENVFTCWAGDHPISLATGDLNEDGAPDLVAANLLSDNVSILLGYGDGTFQSPINLSAGSEPSSVTVGDLDGDGHLDLTAAGGMSNDLFVMQGNGDVTFQDALNYPTGDRPQAMAIGDLDGDGGPDVAVANEGSGDVSVFLASQYNRVIQFTGLRADIEAPANPGDTVTFTADARSSTGDIYYRFDLVPGYGTDMYNPFAEWQTIRDFSTDNTCTHVFDQPGSYMVVVRASPVPRVIPHAVTVEPGIIAGRNPLIGTSVTVGDAAAIRMTGLETDNGDIWRQGDSVTFEVSSLSGEGGDTYYRFFLIPYNGQMDDPTTSGEIIQDFSTDNTCTYTFDGTGGYVMRVWASQTLEMPEGAAPVIGKTFAVK